MIKPTKILDQVGHFAIGGAIAFAGTYCGVPPVIAALLSAAVALVREVHQNRGDDRELRDWAVLMGVPLNLDLVLDVTFWTLGAAVGAWLAS